MEFSQYVESIGSNSNHKSPFSIGLSSVDWPSADIECLIQYMSYENQSNKYSCMSRSLFQMKEMKKQSNYVFLRNIFDSQSEPEQKSDFTMNDLEKAADNGLIDKKVYALGGMNTDNLQIARDLGFGGNGSSMLTASLILGMMILPTIIGLTESALRAVPGQYYEGAVALGATHERAIFRVVLPAAKSGTVAAIVLGVGRAIGETMAVIMVAGNQTWMPKGLFKGVRTLTANIVIEMGYATDLHREALIATGVVLFVFILIINFCVALLNRGDKSRE